MNWLTNFIRPKIRSLVEHQKDVPENLWTKCPACEGMLFQRDLTENLNVCSHCGHHMKIGVTDRLALLFDGGRYETLSVPKVPHDPLKFKDRKKYADRLKEARAKTGREDAIIVGKGTIGGAPVVIAAFDFAFMGGSMGTAVGEGVVTAAESAVKEGAALIVVPASGGARMQEGALSLMQMPRTIVAVEMVKAARLPYIVLLTDPTTGGVSASFAMIGDIHIAEPGCMIGFAGKRVIQETIREELPEGFQTAEYCRDHGMIDIVAHRKQLHETLARILGLLFDKKKTTEKVTPASGASVQNGRSKNGNGKGASSATKARAQKNVRMKARVRKAKMTIKSAANDPASAAPKPRKSSTKR
ncbi:MAG: acetyl-CoA carboxylase carboxyltransferase subunit beta [Alphaproteobacteria bacterium]|nr:acetyl-CoA carboxylase carboxyltransferase subunit beta [Alphaproteobacteria bacterium]